MFARAWVICSLDTELDWPAAETRVQHAGWELILRPPKGTSAADISVQFRAPQTTQEQAYTAICRFLSAYCWWMDRSARIVMTSVCTARIRHRQRGGYSPMLVERFELPALPAPRDQEAGLALALFREAASVGSIPYRFLGYVKIINILHDDKAMKVWMRDTVPKLKERDAVKRAKDLSTTEPDIGRYLYTSGRCAVAHANTSPVVDPDEVTHIHRLVHDMPLAKRLAEYTMTQELGLPRPG
jgi:hypothetical protein